MIKLSNLILEGSYIDPSEAYNDVKALRTVIDNKRPICYVVKRGNAPSSWDRIQRLIKENGLKIMHVSGNESDAYVVYRPGSENDAKKLKDIAEKYGGYLAYYATPEDTREIGRILRYTPEKVEQFIEKHKDIMTGVPPKN